MGAHLKLLTEDLHSNALAESEQIQVNSHHPSQVKRDLASSCKCKTDAIEVHVRFKNCMKDCRSKTTGPTGVQCVNDCRDAWDLEKDALSLCGEGEKVHNGVVENQEPDVSEELSYADM